MNWRHIKSFHSTKEVSKAGRTSGISPPERVSIPLRKFPRHFAADRRPGRRIVSIPLRKFPRPQKSRFEEYVNAGFHSTKEVSKVFVATQSCGGHGRFHSTKEVSKGAERILSQKIKASFHSTKEVSKADQKRRHPCLFSIAYRSS